MQDHIRQFDMRIYCKHLGWLYVILIGYYMLFWDIHNIQIVFSNTTRNSWLSTNESPVEKGHSIQACLFFRDPEGLCKFGSCPGNGKSQAHPRFRRKQCTTHLILDAWRFGWKIVECPIVSTFLLNKLVDLHQKHTKILHRINVELHRTLQQPPPKRLSSEKIKNGAAFWLATSIRENPLGFNDHRH